MSFDLFAGLFYSLAMKYGPKSMDMKWFISVASAFSAAVLACVFSQPRDMILTKTYRDHSHAGFTAIVSSIFKEHGLAGYFIGLPARLMHVASIITSQLVLYDMIKIALGLPVTGSH